MADAIVINKADGDNIEKAEAAAKDFKKALHLYPPKPNGWTPKTMTCSATENTGIEAVWEMIRTYIEKTKESGHFVAKRKQQNKNWLYETIGERLKSEFFQSEAIRPEMANFEAQVIAGTLSPFQAAEQLIGRFKNKS